MLKDVPIRDREHLEVFIRQGIEALGQWGELGEFLPDVAAKLKTRVSTVQRAKGRKLEEFFHRAWPQLSTKKQVRLIVVRTNVFQTDFLADLYGELGIEFERGEDGVEVKDDPRGETPIDSEEFHGIYCKVAACMDPWEQLSALWAIANEGLPSLKKAAAQSYVRLKTEQHGEGETPVVLSERIDRSDDEHTEEDLLGFTLLDNLVIDQVINAVAMHGEHDALDFVDVSALVDEVAHLNIKRSISFHHLGFVDAVFGRELALRSAEDNDDRRAWHLVGWMNGRIRAANPMEAAKDLAGLPDEDWQCFFGSRQTAVRASFELATKLWQPLIEELGDVSRASAWIEGQPALVRFGISGSNGLIEFGRLDEARTLLDATGRAVARLTRGPVLGIDPRSQLDHQLVEARWLRRKSRFGEARRKLRGLDPACLDAEQALTLAVERCRARLELSGYRDLQVADGARRAALLRSINDSSDELSTLLDGVAAPPDLIAASALPIVCGDGTEADLNRAVDRLGQAQTRLELDTSPSAARDQLRQRIRVWRSILVLRQHDESAIPDAVKQLIYEIQREDSKDLPLDLVLGELEVAAVAESPRLEDLIIALLEHRRMETIQHPVARQLLGMSSVRSWFVGDGSLRVERVRGLTADGRLDLLCRLLAGVNLEGDNDAGEVVLDELLAHAESFPSSADRILIEFKGSYPRLCMEGEREQNLAELRLLELAGRTDEVASALYKSAQSAVARRDPEASEWLYLLEADGGYPEAVAELRSRLGACPSTDESTASRKKRVKVLFVGGDERQLQMQGRIKKLVKEEWPRASLTFEHPGWESNWGRKLAGVRKLVQGADTVVTHRFIPTLFGRRLRKMINLERKQWRASLGHAPESIARAICQAILEHVSLRDSQVEQEMACRAT